MNKIGIIYFSGTGNTKFIAQTIKEELEKLDKMKGHEKGVIGIASDLISYDKKYEQIMLNLLGRTVIVDNMETAIKVAKQNS